MEEQNSRHTVRTENLEVRIADDIVKFEWCQRDEQVDMGMGEIVVLTDKYSGPMQLLIPSNPDFTHDDQWCVMNFIG